jgi:hypothetical protein
MEEVSNFDEKTPVTTVIQAFCMMEQGARSWQCEVFTRENGIPYASA